MVIHSTPHAHQQLTGAAVVGQGPVSTSMLGLGAVRGTQHGIRGGSTLCCQNPDGVPPLAMGHDVDVAEGLKVTLGLMALPRSGLRLAVSGAVDTFLAARTQEGDIRMGTRDSIER